MYLFELSICHRASLNDLQIIVPDNGTIDPSNYAELLNGSLVYLCHKDDNEIVSCLGIGNLNEIDFSLVHSCQ